MTAAPDSLLVTGPVFQQLSADAILVTPSGGSQQSLAAALAAAGSGGPIAATTLSASGNVTLSGTNAAVAISPTGTGTVVINPTGASTIDNVALGTTTPLAVKSTTLTATGAVSLSPANAAVALSPTGTGNVVINPATAGTIDNEVIGGGTPLAGTFTALNATSLIATGNVTAAFLDLGVSNNIASIGSNSATALALTKAINILGTATTGTGVILPAISTVGIGGVVTLFNGGAGTVTVYGAGANTIDTVAGTTGVKLSNALRAEYFASTASTYVSAQLGVISA